MRVFFIKFLKLYYHPLCKFCCGGPFSGQKQTLHGAMGDFHQCDKSFPPETRLFNYHT